MRFLLLAISVTLAAQPALYPIRNGRQFGFIDRTGKVVIQPKFDKVEEFRDNRSVVYAGSNAGYIDPTGQLIIPAVFSTATSFEQGRALVGRDGKYSVIDTQGKTIAEIPYRVLGDYSAEIPLNAEIEVAPADRELNLSTLKVDNLYRCRQNGVEFLIHFEAVSRYRPSALDRQVDYVRAIVSKYRTPDLKKFAMSPTGRQV